MLGTPPHSPPSHSPPAKVEVENFVLRVAAEFSSRKEQLIFLINNYDMMLGVLMVTNMPPPPQSPGALPKFKRGPQNSLCRSPPPSHPQERAVEESKEVEGFQQLLSARTQVRAPPLSIFGAPPILG